MRPATTILLVLVAACDTMPPAKDTGDESDPWFDVVVDEPATDITTDISTNDDAIVDLGGEIPEEGGPCDSSPIFLEDGTWVMYGCEFYHHVYKIRLNGEEVTEDLELCGSCGTCIYKLIYTCETWYLLDDGEMSIIVDGVTGIIYTHGRMHTGVPDELPEALELPLETVPHS